MAGLRPLGARSPGLESEQTGPLERGRIDWVPVVAAAGDPGLLQLGREDEFTYELIQPIAVDPQAQLIEVRRWPVLCSDHVWGPSKKTESTDDSEPDAEPAPPAPEANPASAEVDQDRPPPPDLPGAYRIGDRCFTDTMESLTAAQYRASPEDRFPGNFRWVRETVR